MNAKSKKDKLEKDYEKFNLNIEHAAEEEIKKIRSQTGKIKAEAEKIGASIEPSTEESKGKHFRKKV